MAFKAGEIAFQITADDSEFKRSMQNISKEVGNVSRRVGAAFTVAGAAITSFAALSLNSFVETGSALNDMATRVGFNVETLQTLGYAAGMSGAGLSDLETASKKLSRVITEAAQGGKPYQELLKSLGLSYQELAGMKPEDQFMAVGFAIGEIQDPATRAALAMEVFGKSGTKLLPFLLEGRDAFYNYAAEIRAMGGVISGEGVAAADALGDAMDKLKAGLQGFQYQIAAAIAPAVTYLVELISGAMIAFSDWRDENTQLVDTITQIVVGAGLVMLALGPLLIALPGLSVLVAGVTAAFTPMGVAIAAVGAALLVGAYFLYDYIAAWDGWGTLWDSINSVFRAAGNWFSANWEQIKRIATIGKDALLEVLGMLWRGVQSALNIVQTAFNNMLNIFGPTFKSMVTISWDGKKSTLDNFENLAKGIRDFLGEIGNSFDAFLDRVDAFWEKFAWLTDFGTTRIGKMLSWFWDTFGPMLTWNPVRDWLFSAPGGGPTPGGPQYAMAGPGGGGPQYAMAGPGGGGGGGGFGGGISLTFNVSGITDPGAFSRMAAEQLQLELRSRGL